MKLLFKTAAAAALMLGTAAVQPALAQSTGTVIPGLAIANLDAVIANSNAFKTAESQRATTYKAQLTQAETRRNQLQAQIKPMVDKFEADRKGGKVAQATLAQEANAIQQLQASGQQELQTILQPVAMSRAYVSEQIEDKIDDAIKSAMAKKKVSLLIGPDAVLAVNDNAYNLNQDILNELNTILPSAQLVPPAGWEPRQVREAKAAQQQGAAGSTSTQPEGR